MCSPEIVIRPVDIIKVKGLLDQNRITGGNQPFKQKQVPIHAVFGAQPSRIITNVIDHLFGVDIAILRNRFDEVRDVKLIPIPTIVA